MHVISTSRFLANSVHNADAEVPLLRWLRIARHAVWSDHASLRRDFPQTEVFGKYVVFTVGGNTVGLIAELKYDRRRAYVRDVYSRREYDKDRWKSWERRMSAETRTTEDAYLRLVRELPLRLLNYQADLDRDTGQRERSEDEDDSMDVFGTLVMEDEQVDWPMPADLEDQDVLRLHHEASLAREREAGPLEVPY